MKEFGKLGCSDLIIRKYGEIGIDSSKIDCDYYEYRQGNPAAVNAFKGIATNMHVQCGEYDVRGKFSLICACNGRFYGGGFNPSPNATLDDGLLDFYIVKKVSLFTFARCVGKYAAGHADDFPQFITHLRGTDLRIEFEREDVINLDGEALYADVVDMKLLPKALKLIIPDGLGSGTDIPPLSL